MSIKKIHIVLVEPEIPQNTGNIARSCAATGASLHLVHPLGFTIDDRKLKRAGLDYWHELNITYYDSLSDFLCKTEGKPKYYFSTKAKYKYTDIAYPDEVYLVFGKETKGLPEELLKNNPETTVRIPMRENLRSLNLSNAAAIALYEVLRQSDFEGLQTSGTPTQFSWEEV